MSTKKFLDYFKMPSDEDINLVVEYEKLYSNFNISTYRDLPHQLVGKKPEEKHKIYEGWYDKFTDGSVLSKVCMFSSNYLRNTLINESYNDLDIDIKKDFQQRQYLFLLSTPASLLLGTISLAAFLKPPRTFNQYMAAVSIGMLSAVFGLMSYKYLKSLYSSHKEIEKLREYQKSIH